jgi:hypothetical protein
MALGDTTQRMLYVTFFIGCTANILFAMSAAGFIMEEVSSRDTLSLQCPQIPACRMIGPVIWPHMGCRNTLSLIPDGKKLLNIMS